jgi:hypothetical protein
MAWRRTLERELAELVASGQVAARIDSAAKVLTARLADTRTATFQRALAVGARPNAAKPLHARRDPCRRCICHIPLACNHQGTDSSAQPG